MTRVRVWRRLHKLKLLRSADCALRARNHRLSTSSLRLREFNRESTSHMSTSCRGELLTGRTFANFSFIGRLMIEIWRKSQSGRRKTRALAIKCMASCGVAYAAQMFVWAKQKCFQLFAGRLHNSRLLWYRALNREHADRKLMLLSTECRVRSLSRKSQQLTKLTLASEQHWNPILASANKTSDRD